MSAVAKFLLTPEQYLARERESDFRSEYLAGDMFAMAVARFQHNLIASNLAFQLRRQLDGGPCKVLSSDQRVKVSATGLYTYPDVLVVCETPEFEDRLLDTLLNPRVICEVLSESTEAYDRGAKFVHYRQLPSLQEYLLVAQDRPLIERFLRQPDGTWVLSACSALTETMELASISAILSLANIYQGVELVENPGR